MREEPTPPLIEDDEADEFYNSGNVAVCGNRDVQSCLEGVDDLLKRHGLEILCYTGDSDYCFSIVPRAEMDMEEPSQQEEWPISPNEALRELMRAPPPWNERGWKPD